jgi:transcriptional regulator with GAF, ATPase, and Fis domain
MAVRLSQEAPISLKDFMGELEKEVILQVLNHVDGKQTDAARILGMKHTTLHQKIRRYGIRITRVSRV